MDVTLIGGTSPRQMPMNGAATTTSAPHIGNAVYKDSIHCTFQLISAAAATATIEASNDGTNWCPITGTSASSTITLSGAGTGAIVESSAWRYVRCNTSAATDVTTCLMGV